MSVPPISPLVLQDPSVTSIEQESGKCIIKLSSPDNPVSRIAFPILTQQASSAGHSISGYGRRPSSLLKQAVKNAAIEKCYSYRRRR